MARLTLFELLAPTACSEKSKAPVRADVESAPRDLSPTVRFKGLASCNKRMTFLYKGIVLIKLYLINCSNHDTRNALINIISATSTITSATSALTDLGMF